MKPYVCCSVFYNLTIPNQDLFSKYKTRPSQKKKKVPKQKNQVDLIGCL